MRLAAAMSHTRMNLLKGANLYREDNGRITCTCLQGTNDDHVVLRSISIGKCQQNTISCCNIHAFGNAKVDHYIVDFSGEYVCAAAVIRSSFVVGRSTVIHIEDIDTLVSCCL